MRMICSVAALLLAACGSAPRDAAPVSRQMTVNGVPLAWQEQGRGQPVVLVHGCCADQRAWDAHRRALAADYRVISFDQRYWGTAPWPDKGENYSAETQIEDLAAFVRGLGAGPVHLVGWSMSGVSVLGVAQRHPELVRSLFVFEPTVGTTVTDPADLKAMADNRGAIFGPVVALVKAGDLAAATRAAMDAVDGRPGTFDSLPAAFRSMQLDNARTLPLMFAAPPPPKISCEQLALVKQPAAIARGGGTPPSFRIMADTASRCLGAAKPLVVPGASHLWPVRDPAAFVALLRNFLQTVDK